MDRSSVGSLDRDFSFSNVAELGFVPRFEIDDPDLKAVPSAVHYRETMLEDIDKTTEYVLGLIDLINQGLDSQSPDYDHDLVYMAGVLQSFRRSCEKIYSIAIADAYLADDGGLAEVVNGRIIESMNDAWSGRWRELDQMLARTFPSNIAEVNTSRTPWVDCDVDIPRVGNWQRAKNLDRTTADTEYMGIMSRHRGVASEEFRAQRERELTVQDLVELVENAGVQDLEGGQEDPFESLNRLFERMLEAHERMGDELGERNDGASLSPDDRIDLLGGIYCSRQTLRLMDEVNGDIQRFMPGDIDQSLEIFIEKCSLNKLESTRCLAVQAADESSSEIVGRALRSMAEELGSFEFDSAGEAGVSETSVERKVPGQKEPAAEEGGAQTKGPSYADIDSLQADGDLFPWLDGQSEREVLLTERSGMRGVAVVDARSEVALNIEQRMTGYESSDSLSQMPRDDILNNLATRARQIATNRSGLPKGLSIVSGVDKDAYPGVIYYKKTHAHNALRVYSMVARVEEHVTNEALRQELEASGIDRLVVFVGACDKAQQDEMLALFTGKSKKQLRNGGAGSI